VYIQRAATHGLSPGFGDPLPRRYGELPEGADAGEGRRELSVPAVRRTACGTICRLSRLSSSDQTKWMMLRTYNIHEAKTHLSKLVEEAAKGESFLIAKSGKPMVKVIPLDAPEPSQIKRFGFMAGQIEVPDGFNTMGAGEIQQLFEGDA